MEKHTAFYGLSFSFQVINLDKKDEVIVIAYFNVTKPVVICSFRQKIHCSDKCPLRPNTPGTKTTLVLLLSCYTDISNLISRVIRYSIVNLRNVFMYRISYYVIFVLRKFILLVRNCATGKSVSKINLVFLFTVYNEYSQVRYPFQTITAQLIHSSIE